MLGKGLDDEAINCIVEQCYDGVLTYCRRHTASAQDAQDVAQETFLRFVRNRARYNNEGKSMAYLLTIARNLCIDSARSRCATPEDLGEEAIDPASQTEVAKAEERMDINAAIGLLPPDLQEVLELRYGQDLPMDGIAKVLGISRFTVRRRLKAALEKLELLLGSEYGRQS